MIPCVNHSILHVNLTNGELKTEQPDDAFYRKYGGGSAMGLYYILKLTPPGSDPLGPQNTLTFFTGIPTGLPVSGQSRICINARSPISLAIGDSQGGGFFPAALKHAGFDGIVVQGRADQPVYLYLHDGQAEIRDAEHLWGLTTGEAEERIKTELGDPKLEVLQIGPAGEKLNLLAAVMNMHNRANGRTGMGAVMGSKNLKAIVVKAARKSEAVDKATLASLQRLGSKSIDQYPDVKGLMLNGTADVVAFQNSIGSLPTYNYNQGDFDQFEAICGDRMTDTILKGNDTCFTYTVRCKRVVETEYKGRKVLPTYGGPEYETISTTGSYCGISDLNAIALASQLCNMYGLDTIGTGATIAFAMECFENGVLSLSDTDGIELRFGNADAMLTMIEKIGRREGFGAVLADGSARAAERIGRNSHRYLVTTKNTELPAHIPHAKKTLGVIYAVNPFGADHQSSEHDPMYEEGGFDHYYQRLALLGLHQPQKPGSMNEEKIRFAYLSECFYSALDSYSLCQFVWGPAWQLFGPREMAQMLSAATGWEVSVEEILQVGERRLNMMRAFNAREGFTRKEDTLPAKFEKPMKGSGPTAGVAYPSRDLENYKTIYYTLAGWDVETGNPTAGKLRELGLEWIVE